MAETQTTYIPMMRQRYREEIIPSLQGQFKFKNAMQVPRLKKIVVNMGVGEGAHDAKVLQTAEEDLALISGQKPRRTHTRIAVSAFKVRQGMPVGCYVTLRGARMYEFLERLIVIAIPRIRDFRGLSPKSFDGHGNYNFGIKEHQIFLELDFSKEIPTLGMDITLVTTAKNDEECKALLKGFGLPLREA
ncbi:50S ribosomal protein L5 [Candidatus Sumerlaeota bacterium]|nr:50S ribosomal protein L5 [Candidatus Sumerlaeota bacterium]MBI3735142.1 50S ribosomal protein L5 [Candidatus Sumerlaeota bacterium]